MWKRNNDNNDLKERRVNTEIEGLKVEMTAKILLNEIYKKTIDELKNINTQMNKRLQEQTKINSSLLEEFSAIKRERDMLKARKECLIGINEELTENLEAASSQINKLQKTLYLRDSELAVARSANDGLKKKVIELEGTLKATNEKCDKKKLEHENEKLDRINMRLMQERNDLSEQLDDRDSEIHDLKEKMIRLELVIESCNSSIRNAFDHALELEKENSYYKRQVDLVNASMKDLIEKLQAEKK